MPLVSCYFNVVAPSCPELVPDPQRQANGHSSVHSSTVNRRLQRHQLFTNRYLSPVVSFPTTCVQHFKLHVDFSCSSFSSFTPAMKSPLLPMSTTDSTEIVDTAAEGPGDEHLTETSVPMEDVEYFDSYEDIEVVSNSHYGLSYVTPTFLPWCIVSLLNLRVAHVMSF